MSARLGFWLLGPVAGLTLAAAVNEASHPGARVAVLGLVVLSAGLAGEVAGWLRSARAPARPPDTRPADGRVEVVEMPGAVREPNRNDPRFGRFLGFRPVVSSRLAARSDSDRTCPPLLGRVAVVSIFLGRGHRPWSDRELADAHEALRRAGEWVEREAIRYGARVNVDLADTYFAHEDETPAEVAVGFQPEGEEVGPFEQEAGLKALYATTRAAAALGFNAAADLFQTVESRLGADVTVWLLHPRQAGRSFALPRDEHGVSLAVCYPREASFPEPLSGPARVDPVTAVHELLHLFGATDKYGRPLRDFGPQAVTGREVMRLDESRLGRLRVDPATAAEIGWPQARPSSPIG